MIACIFIFIMGIAKNCGRLHTAPLEGHSGGDTIDIALIYSPGSYYIYGDSLSGINKQIGDAFSKDTDTPVKFWPITEPASGMEKLESGVFDILASLPLDNNIKKRFPVSESIFLDRLVLVQLSDSTGNQEINSSLDLQNKTVHVTAGSSAAQRMQNLAEEIGGNIIVKEEPEMSDELLAIQVATGSIPLAVVNEKVAKDLSQYYPNLKYDSVISFTQFQVWLFNASDTILYTRFNEWFDNYRQTEDYREVIKKF